MTAYKWYQNEVGYSDPIEVGQTTTTVETVYTSSQPIDVSVSQVDDKAIHVQAKQETSAVTVAPNRSTAIKISKKKPITINVG